MDVNYGFKIISKGEEIKLNKFQKFTLIKSGKS